jgi:hypothetical protein
VWWDMAGPLVRWTVSLSLFLFQPVLSQQRMHTSMWHGNTLF